MNKVKEDKTKRLNELVAIVKLVLLLLCGIIIFQKCLKERNIYFFSEYNWQEIFLVVSTTFVLILIYTLWIVFTNKRSKYKRSIIQHGENVFFLLFFIYLIIHSGGYLSPYKFIFILIIITTNIQLGMNSGLVISAVSSIFILTLDLISVKNVPINTFFENDLILSGVFILTSISLGYYVKIEEEHNAKLSEMVNIDGLTGVYNHRYFQEVLKEKIKESEKLGENLAIIFLDIDYFKYYNDLYGHQNGDKVLAIIGSILKSNVREKDVVARYGGEEFAVIMPNTFEKEALQIAEKIRVAVERYKFQGEENQPNGNLTVSIGVSSFPDKAKNDLELLKSVDDALYRAKFFHKNRVESYYSVLEELKKDIEEEHIDLITSIKTLISIINAKDRYTYGHVERVVVYCKLMAEQLHLSEKERKILIYGAYMHDIGKINIPEEVINKRMPLTKEEWEMLKQHPQNGVDIIKPVESLKDTMPLILHHHERYDGSGYPDGLRGKNIPYLARVLTVVDSFDAMTSNRPYNTKKSYDEAIEELRKCSGTQFDSILAEEFIKVITSNKSKFDEM
ncbi:bifunctional diguanylate cyclase/phosphohydrolase [Haloimpatiens lingqiaonensis]|uniref:bifunctional diguanylate cyclase/phosphohydrolase n=1 Tax=Haloimpatiens lingqiaonensis TaxID=1380675 RepID=UPI0010FDED6A|nr:diguanylate cyclase [Haloimpatiens lingqiaonensis]